MSWLLNATEDKTEESGPWYQTFNFQGTQKNQEMHLKLLKGVDIFKGQFRPERCSYPSATAREPTCGEEASKLNALYRSQKLARKM